MPVGTAVHSFLMEPVFKPKIQTQAGKPHKPKATARATLKNHMSFEAIVGLGG